jgi:hypothetical protein
MEITRTVATQEIEYLRRLYAQATDRIGERAPAAVAQGRATYHRIFTPNVVICLNPDSSAPSTYTGPDAWADFVIDSLSSYTATQHLIGTQLVEIENIECDESGNVTAGEAMMSSYLQAWHEHKNQKVMLFLGTYYDKVRFTEGIGWQIYEMNLQRVSGEERSMG